MISAASGATSVHAASVQQEIDWIDLVLREPVMRPAVRVGTTPRLVVLGCRRSERPDAGRARAGGLRRGRPAVARCSRAVAPRRVGCLPAHPLVIASLPQAIAGSIARLHCRASALLPGLGGTAQRPALLGRFARLAHWEVEAGGGKIVGLAQCRRRNGTVFSAAVLVGTPPWGLLCGVLGEPLADAGVLAGRTASCAQLLARPQSARTLAASLLQRLACELSCRLRVPGPTDRGCLLEPALLHHG
jgi:hypothetical protein